MRKLTIRRLSLALLASAAISAGVAAPLSAQEIVEVPNPPDYSALNPGAVNEPAVLPRERQTLRAAMRVDLRRDFARLRLHRAESRGRTVWYVITDVSDQGLARELGLNFSPRLRNLIAPTCPACLQTVRSGRVLGRGVVRRPGAVDFTPVRRVVPGPNGGFPFRASRVGAQGELGYSPFVRIAGTDIVYNAPIVAVEDGRRLDVVNHRNTHDRMLDIDTRRRTVDMNFIRAFSHGRDITYLSFESSSAAAGVLDRSTFVPALGGSPAADHGRDPATARSDIHVFQNGKRGRTSPPGQGSDHVTADGLNAHTLRESDRRLLESLRVGGDSHNVLDSFPTVSDPGQRNLYSPLWDIHQARWTDAAVAAGINHAQTDSNQIFQLAEQGLITSPGGGPLRSDRAILNCPALAFLTVPASEDQAPRPPGVG